MGKRWCLFLLLATSILIASPVSALCEYCSYFGTQCNPAISWDDLLLSSNNCRIRTRCFGTPPFAEFCLTFCETGAWDDCRNVVV